MLIHVFGVRLFQRASDDAVDFPALQRTNAFVQDISDKHIGKRTCVFSTDNPALKQPLLHPPLQSLKKPTLLQTRDTAQCLKSEILPNERSQSQHLLAFIIQPPQSRLQNAPNSLGKLNLRNFLEAILNPIRVDDSLFLKGLHHFFNKERVAPRFLINELAESPWHLILPQNPLNHLRNFIQRKPL